AQDLRVFYCKDRKLKLLRTASVTKIRRKSCLVAVVLCALTAAGHDGVLAAAQWVARTSPSQRARLQQPRHPLTGRFRVPDEATIRRLLAALDSDALVSP